jgi:hypothetical protein
MGIGRYMSAVLKDIVRHKVNAKVNAQALIAHFRHQTLYQHDKICALPATVGDPDTSTSITPPIT